MEILFTIVPIFIVCVAVFMFINFFRMSRGANRIFDLASRRVEQHLQSEEREQDRKEQGKRDYKCDHCGAAIETLNDVSPSGDVKCEYCDQWFNIYSDDED